MTQFFFGGWTPRIIIIEVITQVHSISYPMESQRNTRWLHVFATLFCLLNKLQNKNHLLSCACGLFKRKIKYINEIVKLCTFIIARNTASVCVCAAATETLYSDFIYYIFGFH